MPRLAIDLLGGFSARGPAGEACVLPTKKARALLAYLALPRGRFHSRDKLTALLWGDTAEAQAKHSFRQALLTVRRAVRDGQPPILISQGDAFALNPAAVAVDVAAFEAALADGHREGLERAAALYTGDLLDGFSVDESPFEEWRVVERERLHELALEGLAKLVREYVRVEEIDPAIQTGLRILALDPLQEAVHRTLMRLLLRQGRRAAALQQYQVCVGWLQRELGAEPEEETRGLYREVLRSAGAGPSPTDRGAGTTSAPGSQAAIPLIGRAEELDRLRTALGRMLDAGGHVVLVSGEAGIGKTRLIQEFARHAAASGARVAVGRCYETEQVLPLQAWVDALRGSEATLDPRLRDRLGAAGAQLSRAFPELTQPTDATITTSSQPALLFDALVALVRELSGECPLVLVLEDLHWADGMSARFLAFLGRRIESLPVLVIVSMRPEELVDAPVPAQALKELRGEGRLGEVSLRPLAEAEALALAEAVQPARRHRSDWARTAREVWKLGEGNPFVVVESVRALHDNAPDPRNDTLDLARSVHQFVTARLDRLGERQGHVVAVAAAIGRDFPFALLSRAAGIGEREAADAVEELVRRRLFDAVGDALAFCHDWIRQVAYERLLSGTRAVLHGAIGEALHELHGDALDDVADQLGHHYLRAANPRKAIPHLTRFAELAVRRYALDAALHALQQATAGTAALPPAERDRWQLDLALRQAFALTLLARHREVLDLLRAHAAHLTRTKDPALAAEYYFRLAMTHFYFGQQAEGQLAAEQALREAEDSADAECIGKTMHILALNCYALGDPQRGIAYATRGLPLLEGAQTQHYLALLYQDLALNHFVAGNLGSALEAADRSQAIGRTNNDPRVEALGGYMSAWAHTLRGDHELAVPTARRSIELSPDRLAAGLTRGALGQAYLEQGDAASAIPILEQAVERLGSIPIRSAERRYLVCLAEAYLLAGDSARARTIAARALDETRADGMPFNIGMAQRAFGRVVQAQGDVEEAERHLQQALITFGQCQAAFEAARTGMDLAVVRAQRGDVDGARADLATAIAAFDAAGAPKRAAQARELARSLGLDALPRSSFLSGEGSPPGT